MIFISPPSVGGTGRRGRIPTVEDLILWTEFNYNYYDRSGTFIDEATASITMTINTSNNISGSSTTSNLFCSRTFNNESATGSTTTDASRHNTNRYNGDTYPSGRIPCQSFITHGSRWAETKALHRFCSQSHVAHLSLIMKFDCHEITSIAPSLQNKRHLGIIVTPFQLVQLKSTAIHQVTASVDALWRKEKYGHALVKSQCIKYTL
jgi:hypothetical protein